MTYCGFSSTSCLKIGCRYTFLVYLYKNLLLDYTFASFHAVLVIFCSQMIYNVIRSGIYFHPICWLLIPGLDLLPLFVAENPENSKYSWTIKVCQTLDSQNLLSIAGCCDCRWHPKECRVWCVKGRVQQVPVSCCICSNNINCIIPRGYWLNELNLLSFTLTLKI